METIEAIIHGEKFRLKTKTGKRFIAYAEDEDGNKSVCAFKTQKSARDWGFWMRDKYDCLAHGWGYATVVDNKPKGETE